jgi:PAS domain S-box-containing protein
MAFSHQPGSSSSQEAGVPEIEEIGSTASSSSSPRFEETLLGEQGFIQQVMDTSPAGVVVLDRSGRIIFANPRAEQVLGVSRTEMMQRTYNTLAWRITAWDGSPFPDEQLPFRRVLATGKAVHDVRHAIERPDGGRALLGISAAPLLDRAGQVDRVVAIVEDLTQRVQDQQALARSEERFRTLVQQVPAVVYVSNLDEAGTTLYISPQIERMLGFTAEEWIADPELWIKRLHPDDRPLALAEYNRTRATGQPLRCEYRSIARDGREVWIHEEGIALPDRDGQTSIHQGVLVDITERKQAEAALRRAEEQYRGIFENAAVGIFRSTLQGRFLTVNPALARMLGYDSPEELMSTVTDIAQQLYVPPERRAEVLNTVAANPALTRFEVEFRRKDGKVITSELKTRMVRDQKGAALYLEGFVEDITEQRNLEAQLRQAQKMEAVGRLAGGVAHDFNNLLTAILGYSDLMVLRLNDQDPLRKDAEEIKKAAKQASALTSQLLAFSRKQVLQPTVLDLNQAVSNVQKMLKRLIGEDVELVTILGSGLGRVKADPGQVEQVIINLAVNARDAMPQGGQLIIETANVELDEEYVRGHMGAKTGQYVMLAISDTGMGMDAETQSHLFEPFFTTKQQGKGTGLGLATIYGIVKQSEGNIYVYSEPGQGTTFKIYLPRAEENNLTVAPGTCPSTRQRGWETILVVEDNDLVRELIRSVLSQAGYTVLEARNGPHALQVFQQYSGPIQLLVTDVVMPGMMSGRELARRLLPVAAGLKVLYLSGYTDDAIVHHGVLDAGVAFLQKPFTPDVLAHKVREVLDATRLSTPEEH